MTRAATHGSHTPRRRGEPPIAQRLELGASRLRRRLDPSDLPFATTAEVEPLTGTIGQPRALDALEFGVEIPTPGYNLFVTGSPGSGRLTTALSHLKRVAKGRPAPDDWVYVHNFAQPDNPRAIRFPAGQGRRLAVEMDEFVVAARRQIAKAFESDDFQAREHDLHARFEKRQELLRADVERFATEREIALQVTPAGIVTFPMSHKQPLTPEDLGNMTPAEREDIEGRAKEVQDRLEVHLHQLRQLAREAAEEEMALERSVVAAAVAPLVNVLRERYAAVPRVLDHLDAVEQDVPQHIGDFLSRGRTQDTQSPMALAGMGQDGHLARYRVNVVVDNSGVDSAPVITDRNPTYSNLVGRVEFRAVYGAMVTDVSQIRAGSLHRANGGFLVLDAMDLLTRPLAWDALKRALNAAEVSIESVSDQIGLVPTSTLHPEPIPLDLKVVLVGSPLIYALLHAQDDEVRDLFKVRVDFAPDMDWNGDNLLKYAAFVSRCVRDRGLRPLDRGAMARVVEHGSWLREDQRKLSSRLREISDLVIEASFWAGRAARDTVTAEDVDTAAARRRYRSNLVEERIQEMVTDGTVVIATDGERIGEVNGLSVLELADHSFGHPSRVSATVAMGRGTVESIEREIKLSGPLHSKGVLVLSGYLAEKYAQDAPLALRATITFEQSYDEIDGDSASSTELYALLSALSGLPVKQGVAVTGSINQHGDVQAVGGVVRKIEGFFAICSARGLTGHQGVIIPATNVANLMLSDEVVAAVDQGLFHVWAVHTVDEGLELLTGHAAGERDGDEFPRDSVHGLVKDRLRRYSERLRELGAPAPDATPGNGRVHAEPRPATAPRD